MGVGYGNSLVMSQRTTGHPAKYEGRSILRDECLPASPDAACLSPMAWNYLPPPAEPRHVAEVAVSIQASLVLVGGGLGQPDKPAQHTYTTYGCDAHTTHVLCTQRQTGTLVRRL